MLEAPERLHAQRERRGGRQWPVAEIVPEIVNASAP